MYLLINELSFVARVDRSVHAGRALLAPVVSSAIAFKKLPLAEEVVVHSGFHAIELGNDVTIHACLRGRGNDETISAFLHLITRHPYVDEFLKENAASHQCTHGGVSVVFSSLAGAAMLRGNLISVAETPNYSSEVILVEFAADGTNFERSEVHNFLSEGALLKKLWRVYKPTAKHRRGGFGTEMNLDDRLAEMVLNRGFAVPGGRQVYGCHEAQCFEFQPESPGTFHGYPVPGSAVPAGILRKMHEKAMISRAEYERLRSEPAPTS